jgi:amidophosphoribosyltransferase
MRRRSSARRRINQEKATNNAMSHPTEPATATPPIDLDGDRLREECGVFGIFGHPDAAAITALGLHALQHRGQEAAGIVSFDSKRFHSERRLGLVGDNFSRREVIDRLPGMSAMGHVRYSTTGETILRNVQPLFAELDGGGFAVGHNGNLTNGLTLRRQLVHEGAIMQSTSDTEVILHLVAKARKNRFIDRFVEGLRQLEGAYSFVALTNKKLIGARDPLGIRPLVIGMLDGAPILASETCALDIIGAKYVRDVENGEVVVFDDEGMHSHKPFPPMPARPCIFEYIYFARPDSIVGGRPVYSVRKAMGAQLAREALADADVVIPVPDSGVPAAIGYAQESGIAYELGIIRNHYVGRTFIEPTQQIRQLGVRLKHSANRAVVAGKRIVLVDDSIVRGTTSTKIVQMMRDAGAKEVHFRISSPPITHPDYYGIDTPERDKLLAATHDLEGMRQIIGADSLAFLSVDGIYRAMGYDKRDPVRPQFTDHCFTGDYPTPLTDRSATEHTPRQLSLLAEAS